MENEEGYIPLPSKYEFHEYRVIENFIYSLPVEEQQEELFRLIKGKGAFARFRDGLDRFLLTDQWYRYKDKALTEFAREWCEFNKIEIEKEK